MAVAHGNTKKWQSMLKEDEKRVTLMNARFYTPEGV